MGDESDKPGEETAGQGGASEAEGGGTRGAAEAPLADAMADLVGKLWRRGRVELEKAARKGRERLTLRQLRADRDRMYQKLGKEARQLLEAGELEHPGLRRGVERIRELETRILEAEDAARGAGEPVDEVEGGEGGEADEESR